MPPFLKQIDHIHVFVSNRVAAERWYQDVLGLARVPNLAFWAADGGPLTVSNAAGTVNLALFERPALPCRSTIAMEVSAADFQAWQSHLASVLGGEFAAVDHEVSWSLYFSDPDGNPYEITTYDYAALTHSK